MVFEPNIRRQARWYFGGLASSGAVCITHPIDLVKVLMQTQQEKLALVPFATNLLRTEGIMRFYNGISASLLRQMTYTTTRFGIYETGKGIVNTDTFMGKIGLAGFSGLLGGIVGTPSDLVNVRMQNDVKLPPEKRRNYNHAIDGMLRVYREEGFRRLFNGTTTASARGVFMTIGQLAIYEQVKHQMLESTKFKDNFTTHFLASLVAGTAATILTQPLDVIKTRTMNAKPGEFKNIFDVITYTAHGGPTAFFKGIIPAFIRLGPQTILTFLFLEQLRLYVGFLPK